MSDALIKGKCFGIKIIDNPEEYGPDNFQLVLLIEDDTQWIEKDVQFSAYWINDLIEVLKATKDVVKYTELVARINKRIQNGGV